MKLVMHPRLPILLALTALLLVSSSAIAFSESMVIDQPVVKNQYSVPVSDVSSPQIKNVVGSVARGDKGATLTCADVLIVMGEGRSYSFLSKTWSYRPPLFGVKRSVFLDSYNRGRSRIGASPCNWGSEAVSK